MPEKLGSLVMTKAQSALVDGLRPEIRLAQLEKFEQRGKTLMFKLLSPEGMRASLDERFHHFFGRDTMISASFIDAAHEYAPDLELWSMTKQAVFSFWQFQRADGKIIHEAIRNDEMLKKRKENPYDLDDIEGFYRPEGTYWVNDDSIDATPLALIVTPRFVTSEKDMELILPRAKKALRWILENIKQNGGFLRYTRNKLSNQGWMDSEHGVVADDGSFPEDPIALVEAQAFAWKAIQMWSDILVPYDKDFSAQLWEQANALKMRFNEKFVFEDERGKYFAHALDGKDSQVRTPSINPGLGLWASHNDGTIFYDKYVPDVVSRLVRSDFFDPKAGISTFEDGQETYDGEGYHNGPRVYWPFATAMVAKGIQELGGKELAKKILIANLGGIIHFDSFVETFSKNGSYRLFRDGGENGSCKNQAWTIAQFLWSYHYLSSSSGGN